MSRTTIPDAKSPNIMEEVAIPDDMASVIKSYGEAKEREKAAPAENSFCDSAFPESTLSLFVMGAVSIGLALVPRTWGLFGLAALAFAYLIYNWTAIHGGKLDRRMTVFLDEGSLLRNTELFEYEFPAMDECSTPVSGPEIKRPPPRTLYEALFDDRAVRMSEFYKSLYGGEYEAAVRFEADLHACKHATAPTPKTIDSSAAPSPIGTSFGTSPTPSTTTASSDMN